MSDPLPTFSSLALKTIVVHSVSYTIFRLRLQLVGLTEVLTQSLLLAIILSYGVGHPGTRWPSWLLGIAFALTLLLPA